MAQLGFTIDVALTPSFSLLGGRAVAGISDLAARAPGAVFAVDRQLRITAWNRTAEAATGEPESAVHGTICYRTMGAVDADTGRPCYEMCPLVNRSLSSGWVHSRVLRAPWQGERAAYLDCMLLHCALPSAERGALCFISPLDASHARDYAKAAKAIEALYPVFTGAGDPAQGFAIIAQVALQAANADAAELVVLDPSNGTPARLVRQATDPARAGDLTLELSGARVADLIARVQGALVATRSNGWDLVVPIVSDGHLLGTLGVASERHDFSIGHAARALYSLAGQVSVFLRWASRDERLAAPDHPGKPPATATLLLTCFGRLRVFVSGQAIPPSRFRRQKALTLLKVLLAHRGRPLHREALIEILWPEADPEQAGNHLRVVLFDLRHTLEPGLPKGKPSSYVVSIGDLVYLDPSERCWIDAEEFERLARTFRQRVHERRIDDALRAAQAAVALYGADYLEDEPYLDWCVAERERLREVFLDLLQHLATVHAERGDGDEAIRVCRRALVTDSLREQTHRQLMALLARAGRPGEALRQYETCRQLLWQELGVQPDEATTRVRRDILSSTRPLPSRSDLSRR
jgi:DNA-binding SARP family transcriptional activator